MHCGQGAVRSGGFQDAATCRSPGSGARIFATTKSRADSVAVQPCSSSAHSAVATTRHTYTSTRVVRAQPTRARLAREHVEVPMRDAAVHELCEADHAGPMLAV